jgi:hypothetical protein
MFLQRQARRVSAGGALSLAALGLVVGAAVCGAAKAAWRPGHDQHLGIQLTVPYDLARSVDTLVLEPFNTSPERIELLHGRGVATVCYLAAGVWQNWRPDAASVPKAALGQSPTVPVHSFETPLCA